MISLLAEDPSLDRLNLSYRVQHSEIGTILCVSEKFLQGNSPDELRHTRSVAHSVELVLNKHQISGGGAYLDCYL